MKIAFHPEAMREFLEAIDFYEYSESGLGFDFSNEIRTTIRNILGYPNAWPQLSKDVRRCLVNRFPYGVLYSVERDEILILAVMNLRRHPDYWKERH